MSSAPPPLPPPEAGAAAVVPPLATAVDTVVPPAQAVEPPTAVGGPVVHGGAGGEVAVSTAVTEHGKEDHPFFHYYGLLPHQQNMIQDAVRTGTYQNAFIQNPSNFAGKVVLDVGTGTGILAHFAIQAGAKHVYAVEASNMADIARKLIAANGLSDRVTVIRGKVEEVKLPEKVDVIVSEPMGFMLIHERMLESYIAARDLFLKPGGLMMPTTGTIFFCPFTDAALYKEQASKSSFWSTSDFYGLDLSCLHDECVSDHYAQPIVGYFDPAILLSPDVLTHTINFGSDTVADLAEINVPLHFTINKTELLHGLAAWFDVSFNGSDRVVKLSTGPHTPGTHWYQCRLLLRAPIAVNATQSVSGHLRMTVNDKFSYNIALTMTLDGTTITASNRINLHDQLYHYLTNPASGVSSAVLFARTVTDEVPTAYHTSRDVAKAFVHFATSIVSDKASVEESEAKFHGLMKELALLEANLLKAEKMKQRCLLDIEHLEHVRAEIVSKLSRVQSELRDLTAQLASERTLRQNKEEYEALAKKINEVPDRASQESRRVELQEALVALEAERDRTDALVKLRQDQFQLFMHSLIDFKRTVDDS